MLHSIKRILSKKLLAKTFTEYKILGDGTSVGPLHHERQNGMSAANKKTAVVSGASFAGLASAHWLLGLGYDVTVVEIGPDLKRGGTAVNIEGDTVEVVKRMGIFDQVRANRMSLKRWELKNASDHTERTLELLAEGQAPPEDAFEIERDTLLQLLFDLVKDRATFVFGDRITGLRETEAGAWVTFKHGSPRSFDLVLGCDGIHSGVRKLCFGEEAQFVHFLQQYFSITIVDKLLIERDTAQLFNEPGRAVMLNAYKNKTDIIFGFFTEAELTYDYRDESEQRQIIRQQFEIAGWRARELLAEISGSTSFYFDKLCQIRMPSWSKGRVVLVGDAAYCASPAAGKGGSLALDGAAALADAMRAHPDDYTRAFHEYDRKFRPFIEAVQAEAVRTGLETLVPRTEEAIRARNSRTDGGF